MLNIVEKLKINSKSKVNNKDEEFFEKTSTDLLNEVQNEIDKLGEYHTYSYEEGKKKFKKGFIYFNANHEFLGIQAFDDVNDFENMISVDKGMYEELDDLNIGDETEIDESKIIRIW